VVVSREHMPSTDLRQLRSDLDLSRERMARLLDVSAKTVERWETSDRLPASARQRQDLAQLGEIATLGRTIFTPAGFIRFLNAPLPVFGGDTALQMIARGRSGDVLASLAGDYEGSGY